MIERADGTAPVDELHQAVQSFSNRLADDATDVGVVMNAVVVWEEVSFSAEGQQQRATIYACTGDQSTPNAALGLALHLLRTLERDIVGCRCGD